MDPLQYDEYDSSDDDFDRVEYMFVILDRDVSIASEDLRSRGWMLARPYHNGVKNTKTWLVFAKEPHTENQCKSDIELFTKTWLKEWYVDNIHT